MSVVVIVVCFTQPFTLSLLVVVCCHYLFALKATFALEVHVVFTIWYFMNPFNQTRNIVVKGCLIRAV